MHFILKILQTLECFSIACIFIFKQNFCPVVVEMRKLKVFSENIFFVWILRFIVIIWKIDLIIYTWVNIEITKEKLFYKKIFLFKLDIRQMNIQN